MSRLDRPGSSMLPLFGPALILLSLAPSLVLLPCAHAATVRSTVAGGPWPAGSTWVGGVVPGATDDVILDGPVGVEGTASCAGLDVSPGGALRNGLFSPSTLIVTGAVGNAGTIEDGSPSRVLRLRVGGDLDNDGVWTNVETILVGAADHRLLQSALAVFEGHLTRDPAATGGLFLDSPFAILGNLDQDGGRVELAPDCPLTLRGGALSGDVFAEGNEIRFESWSYIDGGTFDNAVLSGPATTTGGTFTGRLTVLDSLSNVGSFGNAHIFIQGDLVNHGMIHNANYGFTIDLTGDLECNGTILNSFIALGDAQAHHLRMGANGDLRTDLFLPEFGAGTIVVETDARISDGIALGMGGTMILEPGITLHLSGGSISGGTLLAQGSDIFMEGGGYLWVSEADDLVLRGTVQTAGSMSVTGSVHVFGTLQSWPFITSEISIDGDLVNRGHIRDSAQTLTLRIRGGASNGGVWENRRVVVDGVEDQLVEIGAGIAVPEFVLAAGFTASSYQWTRDGVPLDGETSHELELATVSAGDAGLYRCEGGEGQLSRAIVLREGVAATETPEPHPTVSLAPLRPNPLRAGGAGAAATIEFALPAPGDVRLGIFDVAGREVARLASRSFPAGTHRLSWPVSGAAPGVYFVRLESAGVVATGKLTVIE